MYRPIFWKTKQKTDASFLDAVKRITKITFNTTTEAKNWLLNNGYWTNF
jgi:hypothetical protein